MWRISLLADIGTDAATDPPVARDALVDEVPGAVCRCDCVGSHILGASCQLPGRGEPHGRRPKKRGGGGSEGKDYIPRSVRHNHIQRPSCSPGVERSAQTVAQMGIIFSVPIYFQVSQRVSDARAGAYLFRSVFGNAVGSVITGLIIKRYHILLWSLPKALPFSTNCP